MRYPYPSVYQHGKIMRHHIFRYFGDQNSPAPALDFGQLWVLKKKPLLGLLQCCFRHSLSI